MDIAYWMSVLSVLRLIIEHMEQRNFNFCEKLELCLLMASNDI